MARNNFAGTCYRCGGHVAAGAGHFEKIVGARWPNPRWRIQHAGCAIAYRGTKHEAPTSTQSTAGAQTDHGAA